MFKKILVEREIIDHPRSQAILSNFNKTPIVINKVEEIFGRVKKDYSNKQDNLYLFIGKKKGLLVKPTPPAYGYHTHEKHYYFIHAYNCLYDCQYCYLQGYFNSPDLVVFINHEEIIEEMQKIVDQNSLKHDKEKIWFHAGEFSDSLAFSQHTQEWQLYWKFFEKNPHAQLELRTKSNQIRVIEFLKPLKNIIISFSLNPSKIVRAYEKKTPTLAQRLTAMEALAKKNFRLGIHFDPIIYVEDYQEQYLKLVEMISKLPFEKIIYISLGTMRFSKDLYKKIESNHSLIKEQMIIGYDKKMRYLKPLRLRMVKYLNNLLIKQGFPQEKIYYCMED